MCNWHISYMNKLSFPYIVTKYDKSSSGFLGFLNSYYIILLVNLFDCNEYQCVFSDNFKCLLLTDTHPFYILIFKFTHNSKR